MKRFFLLLPFVFALQAAHAQTQPVAMSLAGSVLSEERRPLPGAAITVIHLPSGARHAAASDASGRFLVSNLLAGGPYLIRVGESGYRSQTLENIFLANGKASSFTLTLNKLDKTAGKGRNAREPDAPQLALAPEAVVGGPVLITTLNNQPPPAPAAPVAAPAASPASGRRARPAPAATAPPVAATSVAAAPSMAAAPNEPAAPRGVPAAAPVAAAPVAAAPNAPAPNAAARYSRAGRYPARRPAAPRTADAIHAADFVVPGHFDAKTGDYIYETGQPTTLQLADGNAVAGVGLHSTESNLYRFITDPQMQIDTVDLTRGWYSFDRVYFDAGQATLTHESVAQLRNIAAILKAYPRARIKLSGYTDASGDFKINKALSEDRAHAAWYSLVGMGISPARIDARGYGPRYSIATNTTEEGRAMNRRLSVKVVEK